MLCLLQHARDGGEGTAESLAVVLIIILRIFSVGNDVVWHRASAGTAWESERR